MVDLYGRIATLGPADSAVLIEGETGTGKELVARALHGQSRRSGGPFVPVNAATLTRELFESELFGHRKGAFSGANGEHEGLAKAADGGTLFFDEIAELSPVDQAKLLRFLDSGEVRRVGGVRARQVDARILFATNRNLRSAVQDGTMRPDLYYRLRVLSIRVPRLEERLEDLPLLVAHFVRESADRCGKRIPAVSGEAMERLLGYDWPGNVREVKHEISQAVVLTPDGEGISAEVLSSHLKLRSRPAAKVPARTEEGSSLRSLRRQVEREVILRTLERYAWNVSACARALDISRVGLTRKLKGLGIRRPGGSHNGCGDRPESPYRPVLTG